MITATSGSSINCLQRSKGPRREALKCCFVSLAKSTPKPSVPLAEIQVCSKRQILFGGASLLLAPLLDHQASAKQSSADTKTATFKGFDGLGGSHADYANAQVWRVVCKQPAIVYLHSHLIHVIKPHLLQDTWIANL